jgi:hypothetical protein
MAKEGYLTKELFQEFIEKMKEEEKKGWIFEKHYWNECQKQYELSTELLRSGHQLNFSECEAMIIKAGQIAREKTEEEWLEKQQQKQTTKK